MDLLSLIQKANLSHASVLTAIDEGSDKQVDSLSLTYEKYVKSVLEHKPGSLIDLERKISFILQSLLTDHEDSTQARIYTKIILNDIQHLIAI